MQSLLVVVTRYHSFYTWLLSVAVVFRSMMFGDFLLCLLMFDYTIKHLILTMGKNLYIFNVCTVRYIRFIRIKGDNIAYQKTGESRTCFPYYCVAQEMGGKE